jgi:prepilin-type N-terminal cleavage/methylation domain-containing protein
MKKSNQKGFTLLEILIAMAVTAIIGLAIGRVVIQVMSVNAGSNTREIAIKQVENAVHIISRDALQTQIFSPVNSLNNPKPVDAVSKEIVFDLAAGDRLILTWTSWDSKQTAITYDLLNKKLRKSVSINGGQPVVTEIANSISVASGDWHTDGKFLDFNVTANVTGYKTSTETRTFQIAPAPAQ